MRVPLALAHLGARSPGVGVGVGAVAVGAHVVLHHKVHHKRLLQDRPVEHLGLWRRD